MRLLGNLLMIGTAVALMSCPLVFHITSGGLWRFSVVGRALMTFMTLLGTVMIFALLNLAIDPLPSWVRPLTWFLVGTGAWWQIRTLIIVRRRGNGI